MWAPRNRNYELGKSASPYFTIIDGLWCLYSLTVHSKSIWTFESIKNIKIKNEVSHYIQLKTSNVLFKQLKTLIFKWNYPFLFHLNVFHFFNQRRIENKIHTFYDLRRISKLDEESNQNFEIWKLQNCIHFKNTCTG